MLLVRMLLLGLFCFLKLMYCQDNSSQITPTDVWPLSGTANGNLTEKQMELEKRKNDLEVAINETEGKLNEAKEEMKDLKENRTNWGSEIATLNMTLEELNNDTANAGAEKQEYLEKVNAKKAEIRNVTQILKGIEANLQIAINNTKQETARHVEQSETVADLQSAYDEARLLMKEYGEDIKKIPEMIKIFKEGDSGSTGSTVDPRKPLAYWNTKLLNRKFKEAKANVTALKEKMEADMKTLNAIKEKMDGFSVVQRELETKMRTTNESLHKLNESLNDQQLEYDVRQSNLENAQSSEGTNLERLKEMEAELAKLTNETIPVAKKKIEDIKEELGQQKEELRGVNADIVKERERTPEPVKTTTEMGNRTEGSETESEKSGSWTTVEKAVLGVVISIVLLVIAAVIVVIVVLHKRSKNKKAKGAAVKNDTAQTGKDSEEQDGKTEEAEDKKEVKDKKEEEKDKKEEAKDKKEEAKEKKEEAKDKKEEVKDKKEEVKDKKEEVKDKKEEVKEQKEEVNNEMDDNEPVEDMPEGDPIPEVIDVVSDEAICEIVDELPLTETNEREVPFAQVLVKFPDDTNVFTLAPPKRRVAFKRARKSIICNTVYRCYTPVCSVVFDNSLLVKEDEFSNVVEIDARNNQFADMANNSPLPWKPAMDRQLEKLPVPKKLAPPADLIEINRKLTAALLANRNFDPADHTKKIVRFDMFMRLLDIATKKLRKMPTLVRLKGRTFVISSLMGDIPSLIRILANCGNGTLNRICMYPIVLNGCLIDGNDFRGSVMTLFYFLSLIAIAPRPIVWLRGRREIPHKKIKSELQREFGEKDGKKANAKLLKLFTILPLMAKCGKHLAVPGGAPKRAFTMKKIKKTKRPIGKARKNKLAKATVFARPDSCIDFDKKNKVVGPYTYYAEKHAKNYAKRPAVELILPGQGVNSASRCRQD